MDALNKINRNEILYQEDRLVKGPIPNYWTRIHVPVVNNYYAVSTVCGWVAQNLTGPWAFYTYYKTEINKKKNPNKKYFVCLAFEDPQDKFIFEMMGGYDIEQMP